MPGSTTPNHWPKLGASIAVFRDGRVLIVERAKPPLAGVWSLPGGQVEPGEAAADAALRELAEETGVTAQLLGLAGAREIIRRAGDGSIEAHYVVLAHAGLWRAGEPVPRSDVSAARFVAPADLDHYRMTEGAAEIIRRAEAVVSERASMTMSALSSGHGAA
jgi:ADP-ribose pyrophosphatase YjhB (NUDIX family)